MLHDTPYIVVHSGPMIVAAAVMFCSVFVAVFAARKDRNISRLVYMWFCGGLCIVTYAASLGGMWYFLDAVYAVVDPDLRSVEMAALVYWINLGLSIVAYTILAYLTARRLMACQSNKWWALLMVVPFAPIVFLLVLGIRHQTRLT